MKKKTARNAQLQPVGAVANDAAVRTIPVRMNGDVLIWGPLEYHLPWDTAPKQLVPPVSLLELRDRYAPKRRHPARRKKGLTEVAAIEAALAAAWAEAFESLFQFPDTTKGNSSRVAYSIEICRSALEVALASTANVPPEHMWLIHDRLFGITRMAVNNLIADANTGQFRAAESLVDLATLIIVGLENGTSSLKKNLQEVASRREKFPVLLGNLREDRERARRQLVSLKLATATLTRAVDPKKGRPISLEKPINQLARSLLLYFDDVRSSTPAFVGLENDSTLGLPPDLYRKIIALPELEKKNVRKWVAVARELIRHRYHLELGDIPEVQDLGAGRRTHSKNDSGTYVGIEANQTDGLADQLGCAFLRMVRTK